MPPYYFIWLPLVSLDRLKSGFEPLVELREVTRVGQHRLSYGFKENPLSEGGPTSTANGLDKLRVIIVARKVGHCNFHFAKLPLESLNLFRGYFGF
jgi:hypothetical protein